MFWFFHHYLFWFFHIWGMLAHSTCLCQFLLKQNQRREKYLLKISVVFQWNGPSYIFLIGLTWIDFCAAIYSDRSWSPRTRLFITLDNDDFSFDDWSSALWARSAWAISQPRTTLVVLLVLHFWLPAGAWKNWLLKSTLAIELMLMIEEEWLCYYSILMNLIKFNVKGKVLMLGFYS